MVSQCLIVLLISSVYSSSQSSQNESSNLNESLSMNESSNFNAIKTILQFGKDEIRLDQYLSLQKMGTLIDTLVLERGDIVRKTSLGLSAQFKSPIWAVEISRDVNQERPLLRPMFRFSANIHGDDVVGYSLLASLTQYLVYSDGPHNPRIQDLLNNTHIWIIPTINPDGFRKSKVGSNGTTYPREVNLDKDFPLACDLNYLIQTRQPETLSMLKHITTNPVVLSANLQGGDVVASYLTSEVGNGSKDDSEIFEKLARDYAAQNPIMKLGRACGGDFHDGITTRSVSKAFRSMQYANYELSNTFELTLYVSCSHHPPADELPFYWFSNLNAMLTYMESTRQGVYGLVMNKNQKPVIEFKVRIQGMNKEIKGTARGEYWRLLVPGSYNVTVRAPAAETQTKEVEISPENPIVQLNFKLHQMGVYGRVTYTNGAPLNGAVIKVGKPGSGTKTNEKGEYSIMTAPGRHQVTVSLNGYSSDKKWVEVSFLNEPYVKRDFVLRKTLFSNFKDCTPFGSG